MSLFCWPYSPVINIKNYLMFFIQYLSSFKTSYTTMMLKVVFGCSLMEVKRSILQITRRGEWQPQTCVSLILQNKYFKSQKVWESWHGAIQEWIKAREPQELAEPWGPSASEMCLAASSYWFCSSRRKLAFLKTMELGEGRFAFHCINTHVMKVKTQYQTQKHLGLHH